MFLGIDLGTSALKVLLVDEAQRVRDQASVALTLARPAPQWSEQDPAAWWSALVEALAALRTRGGLGAVRAIGIAGQMHGATLLDAADRVLRPCILWNDGRAAAECAELERREPRSRAITGNLAMPGFTAPKLLWVKRHEPEVFARIRRVLMPKDWLRLQMTGEAMSEPSDAAGTLWLDVGARRWSSPMLAACDLRESAMPGLVSGDQASGVLRRELARDWGMREDVAVAGGAGDNAAGAIGIGAVAPGDAFVSLGTSGVIFAVTDRHRPAPARGLHAFCHCLEATWHQMAVILSAASCLSWVVRLTGARDEAALLAEIERERPDAATPIFLPYLSGERTPHNDAAARGVFADLDHDTTRASLGRAVLEGVAFALADGAEVMREAGSDPQAFALIGGGARSPRWGRIIASALARRVTLHEGGELGPAFGAARLARLASSGDEVARICTAPPVAAVIEPDPALVPILARRHARFRALYPASRAPATS